MQIEQATNADRLSRPLPTLRRCQAKQVRAMAILTAGIVRLSLGVAVVVTLAVTYINRKNPGHSIATGQVPFESLLKKIRSTAQ